MRGSTAGISPSIVAPVIVAWNSLSITERMVSVSPTATSPRAHHRKPGGSARAARRAIHLPGCMTATAGEARDVVAQRARLRIEGDQPVGPGQRGSEAPGAWDCHILAF